jgi:beta-glucosidase
MSYFPKEFLLGAATAAHQVEGNNTNSDFWTMEQIPQSLFKEPSLECLDHYNHYREDIDLLAGAGLNAYRFSIEWARIQPDKDTFDQKEIYHYRDMISYCREKGVSPIVTMHHFSSPKWLIQEGLGSGNNCRLFCPVL